MDLESKIHHLPHRWFEANHSNFLILPFFPSSIGITIIANHFALSLCQLKLNVRVVWVRPGCCNKVSQTGWLEQEKCICSQILRLQIQAQDAIRLRVWLGLSFWLPESHLPAMSSHDLYSVHLWRERSLVLFPFL